LTDAQGYFDGENVIIRLKNSFHLKMLENRGAADILKVIVGNLKNIDAKVIFELTENKAEIRNDLSELSDT